MSAGSRVHTHAPNGEEKALEAVQLVRCDRQETRRAVKCSTRRRGVFIVRVGGNEEEGGAGVNDASSRREDRCVAVRNRLIDTPVLACRRSGGDGPETQISYVPDSHGEVIVASRVRNVSRELARVGAAERELAIDFGVRRRRLKGYPDNLGGDRTLRQQVVRNRRDGIDVVDCGGGQIHRPNALHRSEYIVVTCMGNEEERTQGCHPPRRTLPKVRRRRWTAW